MLLDTLNGVVMLHCQGAKTMKHYLEIVERKSGKVSKRIDCFSQHDADRIEPIVNRNLDHENFFVRSVDQKELSK